MAGTDSIGALAEGFDRLGPTPADITNTPFDFFSISATNAASGGVLLFSFLLGVFVEQRKVWAGQSPTWSVPILRLIIFTALLASYNIVATTLIHGVLSLGSLDPQGANIASQNVFAARATAFAALQEKFQGDNALLNVAGAGLSTFFEAFLNVLTAMSFVFAAAIVFVLKIVQGIMLKVLFVMGPLMIGVASIPHPSTSKYLEGWIVSIVEVGLWGFIGRIFLSTMATHWNVDPGKFTNNSGDALLNFFELIIFNIVYAFAFMSIPVMSAIIVRGASSSGVGSSALGAATGAAAGAAAAGRGAGGGLSQAFSNFRGAAGGGDDGAGGGGGGGGGGRAGDSGGGGTDAPLGSSSSSSRSGDAATDRRAAFARDGAIRKQEREGDD